MISLSVMIQKLPVCVVLWLVNIRIDGMDESKQQSKELKQLVWNHDILSMLMNKIDEVDYSMLLLLLELLITNNKDVAYLSARLNQIKSCKHQLIHV